MAFSKFYVPIVEIKDFHVLIDGKRFFVIPVNTTKNHMKRLKMSRNNNSTVKNLLNY